MLTKDEQPVAWILLLDELQDAQEHLAKLIDEMTTAGKIDELDYSIQLGHIFAHLNRAWQSRGDITFESISQETYAARSQFPTDLRPVG